MYNDIVEVAALLDLIQAMDLSPEDLATAEASIIGQMTPDGVPTERMKRLVAAVRKKLLAAANR